MILSAYAIRDYIDSVICDNDIAKRYFKSIKATYKDFGDCARADGQTSVLIFGNNINISTQLPCVLVDNISDLPLRNGGSKGLYTVQIVYKKEASFLPLEMSYEILRKAFKKRVYKRYYLESGKLYNEKKEGAEMIFTHVLEYVEGSDRATGEIKVGNTSYSYKQFAVSSLKTNI